MNDYLTKPIQWNELKTRIDQLANSKLTESLLNEFSWDLQAAIESMGGDVALLQEVIELLLSDLDMILRELSDAMKRRDVRGIVKFARQLKSSAEAVYLSWLTDRASAIHYACDKGELSEAESLLDELDNGTPRLKRLLIETIAGELQKK